MVRYSTRTHLRRTCPQTGKNPLPRVLVLCFNALMPDTATTPAELLHPDPDRAASARLDSAGAGTILRLLRTLFAYGSNLVQTLRQERDPDDIPWYGFVTSIFGTTNPALITVTIIRGLLRATALQATLSKSVATLLPLPLRAWAAEQTKAGGKGPRRGSSPRLPRATGWTIPPGWPAGVASLDREPSPEEEMFAEIVAEDQDRPISAILLEICLDLGIVPDLMDPATWDELSLAITLYGGDPAPLVALGVNAADPAGTPSSDDSPIPAADSPPPHPQPRTTGIVYPPWPSAIPAILGPRWHRPTLETDH